MTTTGDLRIDDWVVHRPNVVRSVAARVPGIDAEEATSRALEKMVRIVSTGGQIDDPAPYWRRAAVNEAISMTREAGRARPVEDNTLDGLAPPVEGAELDAERQADVSMLRTALAGLADDDRQILLDRHVHDKAVTDIATGLGVRPHAVTMRLRRAEERLAGAFAAAHAQAVNEPECRTTRAAMHDYLKGRLLPRRQRRLEVHMDGCTECTRAFIDVREVSWMLRDLGQHLIAGAMITGTVGAVGAGSGGVRPRSFGTKETAVAAGVLAALALGGGAAALIAGQADPPPLQAFGPPPAPSSPEQTIPEQTTPDRTPSDQPPSIPPADPQPRPASTPKEDAAPEPDRVVPPQREVAAPAPTSEPEPEVAPVEAAPAPPPAQEPVPAPAEAPATERPAAAAPPEAEPAPAPPAAQPPAPAPEPKPESEPKPERPPEPAPQAASRPGPPGNPDNANGRGPAKENGQGPGSNNGKGPGTNNGNGPGTSKGRGPGNSRGYGRGADRDEQSTSWYSAPGLTSVPGALLSGVGLKRLRRRPTMRT